MNAQTILQSDLLDIVFENRNKQYGAYTLRKNYNKTLFKAIAVMMSIMMVMCGFSFIKPAKSSGVFVIEDPVYEVKLADIKKAAVVIPEKLMVPKSPERKVKPQVQTNKQLFVSKIVITKNDLDITKLPMNLDSVQIASNTNASVNPSGLIVDQNKNKPGSDVGDIPAVNVSVPDRTQVLGSAEVMPKFPGGMSALQKFLEKNLRNPEDVDNEETVTVKVKFIVGYDGKLKGFETIEDGGKPYNDEVIRVLKKMPNWEAGISNGQKVSVYYVIPVKFTASR